MKQSNELEQINFNLTCQHPAQGQQEVRNLES